MVYLSRCTWILFIVISQPQVLWSEIVPRVNGFLRLTFSPSTLENQSGHVVSGQVNVTIDEDVVLREQLLIQPCCVDERIAQLASYEIVPARNNSVFSVTVYGSTLGRTSIKFMVVKNESSRDTSRDQDRNRKDEPVPNSTSTWWLPFSYHIVVRGADHRVGFYLSCVVLGLVAVNLIGIGGQLDGEEIICLLKKPTALCVGMVCRFGVMPSVALGIIELIQPERNTSLGVLSLICSPAEGASTLLIMLAEGDLTFAVTLTSVNNFATVGMLPLWAILFETRIYQEAGQITIPFEELFAIFAFIVITLAMGFLLHRRTTRVYHTFWTYLPTFTILTLLFTLFVEIYASHFIFSLISKEILCACAMLAACGYIFGAVVAFIAQQSHARILVNCLESGARTTFITGLLLEKSLPQPESDIAKTAPVLCVLLSLFPAMCAVIVYRAYKRFLPPSEKKLNESLGPVENCVTSDDDDVADDVTECLSEVTSEKAEVVGEKETCM